MALFRTASAAVYGIEARPIDVEVDVYKAGLQTQFVTVGMPDTSVKESRERIRSALIHSGFGYPPDKSVTISLAPATVRKEGAGFDLPMAMGLLGALGQVGKVDDYLFAGELSLDGSLRPIRGALSMAVCARKAGKRRIVVPQANAGEASVVEGIEVFGLPHLTEAVRLVRGEQPLYAAELPAVAVTPDDESDFADVKGQTSAKRALEVAAAGGHNVLMVGPPGSGKTMLARRLAGILPRMTFAEALEATQVHSVAGLMTGVPGLLQQRPVRAPHHTISPASLIGGGTGLPRPGEASLAHNGVLFLDELPEFPRNVLELLRQPIENGSVTIGRSQMSLEFPARFMLVAAMNPCPCGFHGDTTRECRCTGAIIHRYLGKISGPLLDRIDLHVEVPAVPYGELRGKATTNGADSSSMRERVERARSQQHARGAINARIPPKRLREICALDAAGERTLEMAVRKLALSARAHDRILRVARTIADIAGSPGVESRHVAEAVQYRTLDRSYWS